MSAQLTRSPAWQALMEQAREIETAGLSEIIAKDPKRLKSCEIALDGLRFNYALNRATSKTVELLCALARQQKLEDGRARMFGGEKINATENRAALHTALRQKSGTAMLDGKDVLPEVKAVRARMNAFAAEIRDGRRKGFTGKPIRHIVNIGIGGSDLGPRLAVRALEPYTSNIKAHFVANADAFDLLSVLKPLDPAETLFIVVSKTFTTQETLLNARSAREWIANTLGEKAVRAHFAAVSTNTGEAEKFGIDPAFVFPMWDWVGGRFSLWSAVGLSIVLAIGAENFEHMLEGAAAMDAHFRDAPLEKNMPAMLALFGIWQRNFLNAPALAILPYSERLRDLPRYLQQLEMESNGKTVTLDGDAADYATAPIIFGECGTVGQHSFHQWLHQGADMIPADFIAAAEDDLQRPEHHRALLANMAAQATALAFGKPEAEAPQDVYAGNRSSNIIMLERLDPYRFGMLLALYEHKVFTQGAIWNINSFDQPGVELGKKLASGFEDSRPFPGPAGDFMANLARNMSSIFSK